MIPRRVLYCIPLLIISVFIISGCKDTIKEPAVAGSFYPADRETLTKMVDGFISSAENNPASGKLIALVTPHAGYQYSGHVAGYSYRRLQGKKIRTVILIGPSHSYAFKGASVYDRGKWKTPLGMVRIDSGIAGSLINAEADVTFRDEAFEKEHSLEVQVPFLQRVVPNVRIVPILIGMPTRPSFDFLRERLTEIMGADDGVILIASTDFSHYHDYETAVSMDMKTINAIERMSVGDVQRHLMSREGEMCGGNAVLYTMAVARNLGATNSLLFKYANSGDVTGDRSRVVGYAAMGLYKTPLTGREKEHLLSLAKKTITQYVTNGELPETGTSHPRLNADGATFVTIKAGNGRLRGCMGDIFPSRALYTSVIRNAVNACSRDPRFRPMTPDDLNGIDVEVTVLSPLEPLKDTGTVEIGKHGLYLVKDDRSGILLPQIPVEFGWDRDTFLKQVSKKAGLPEDAWKEANLYSFTAEIIR